MWAEEEIDLSGISWDVSCVSSLRKQAELLAWLAALHSFKPSIPTLAHYLATNMSSNTTAVNPFNKTKENFILFVNKAVHGQKSYSHAEMYHSLLKLFVDVDTNKDG